MRSPVTLAVYLIATATSFFGNAAIAVVLPWLVLARTGDPALSGLVAAISAAPAAVAAFVGGHLVDKVGRRRISVLADAGSALSVAALALVDATWGLTVAWFVALGVLGALFDVPGMTARQALMADVARASGVSLDRVSAWQSALFALSYLAGPALAGVLLATLPAGSVLWLTAGSSAVAALLIAGMRVREGGASPDAEVSSSPLAGWSIVTSHPALRALLAIQLIAMLLVAPLLSVILPAHFRSLGAPDQLGFSLSAYAVGSIAGAGLYAWLCTGRRWTSWVASNILYIVSFLLIGTLAGFWPVAAGLAVAGVAAGLQNPVVQVLLTEAVPEAARGRVFGLFSALSSLASPVGLAVTAALLTLTDVRTVAVALGVLWIGAAGYALLSRGLRARLRDGAPDPTPVAAAGTPTG